MIHENVRRVAKHFYEIHKMNNVLQKTVKPRSNVDL